MRLATLTTVLVTSLLVSCSGGHSQSNGTSALAKQLVGHWTTRSDDHLYFGAIDPASKLGSYILVHPDGKVFTHRYGIESEKPRDRTLILDLKFASGESAETTYVLSADGNTIETTFVVTGIETHSQLTKVDDKTSP